MSDAFKPRRLAPVGVAAALAVLCVGCGGSAVPFVKKPACSLDLGALSVSGCRLLTSDTGALRDPRALWGRIDCASDARHRWIAPGYRRLTVLDGDNVFGERCELGANDYRAPTFSLYREGDHRVTFLSIRLPAGFPLSTPTWQLVMQMKQTQPSENGNGTPVLALEARQNRWKLFHSASVDESDTAAELWSAPAATGTWTRFAFDVVYSQSTERGRVKVYVDLDGDGDARDPGEQSPEFATYTLKREPQGESIPSHLRVGVYHNRAIACPAPRGCGVDVDNVEVLAAP